MKIEIARNRSRRIYFINNYNTRPLFSLAGSVFIILLVLVWLILVLILVWLIIILILVWLILVLAAFILILDVFILLIVTFINLLVLVTFIFFLVFAAFFFHAIHVNLFVATSLIKLSKLSLGNPLVIKVFQDVKPPGVS